MTSTRSSTPEARRRSWLKRKFGISPEEYDLLLAAHGGGCWICGKKPTGRRLHIDHRHIGRGEKKAPPEVRRANIRGLLCWADNAGRYGDDPSRLRAAAAYLESDEAQRILAGEPV